MSARRYHAVKCLIYFGKGTFQVFCWHQKELPERKRWHNMNWFIVALTVVIVLLLSQSMLTSLVVKILNSRLLLGGRWCWLLSGVHKVCNSTQLLKFLLVLHCFYYIFTCVPGYNSCSNLFFFVSGSF